MKAPYTSRFLKKFIVLTLSLLRNEIPHVPGRSDARKFELNVGVSALANRVGLWPSLVPSVGTPRQT
jgi:hypothetical protein